MDINLTIVIAIATFLWYRKGRLWNLYDSIIKDSIEQVNSNSLDRESWEKMARKNCDLLAKELFKSLFRFEIEYLRNKIIDNQYTLWISDASADSEKVVIYTDKEKFCKHSLKEMFYKDFRFCGFPLFIKSIMHLAQKNKDQEDTGYTEKHFKK